MTSKSNMYRMLGLLCVVGTATLATPSGDGANPALHTLAGFLEHDDGTLGALARLYKQVDQIADGEEHIPDDELYDDTMVVGER
jgi:hypothetical protein